jgi:hypothetical protein
VKRLVLSLAVMVTALALAAGVALAQANTGKFSVTVPIDEVAENPCTGELVHFTGNLRILGHFTQDANGGVHLHSSVQPRGISGTGLESGTRYRGVGVSRSGVYFPPGEEPRQFTIVSRFHVVSEGSSDNWIEKLTIHVTVSANGELTAEVVRFTSRCVG